MSEQKLGTLRWENKPVDVKVGTYDADRKWTGSEFIENIRDMVDEGAAERFLAEQDVDGWYTPEQYAAVCAERDRYIARCKELEARLQAVREAAR